EFGGYELVWAVGDVTVAGEFNCGLWAEGEKGVACMGCSVGLGCWATCDDGSVVKVCWVWDKEGKGITCSGDVFIFSMRWWGVGLDWELLA
ncbi:hypothetical protein Tco_0036220, partial [Tanacetum coccineum]